jgi:hypothetical protein
MQKKKHTSPAEDERLHQQWKAEYPEEGQLIETLLEQLVLADRELKLAQRRCAELEASLEPTNPLAWTKEQHRQMQLFLRYRTTAERSFYRALGTLEAARKARKTEQLRTARTESSVDKKLPRQSAPRQSTQEERPTNPFDQLNDKPVEAIQSVFIRTENGRTITEYDPTNEVLLQLLRESLQIELVTRHLYFNGAVPKAYRWCKQPEEFHGKECRAKQRMTRDTWFKAIEREKNELGGHVGQVEEVWD